MALWLIAWPLLMAALAFAVPSNRLRPWLLPLAGSVQLLLAGLALTGGPVAALDDWLMLDPLGKVFLGFVALMFFLCSWYAPTYLALRREIGNRILCACLLLTLAMMSLMILSHHLGLMWVAMEATTLATAPCLYFERSARSLEATWKYLLVCSVGIALALLGSFFLAYASLYAGQTPTLFFDGLMREAPRLSQPWLHAAFVLLLVGYGTKMGLAPMHTWKPDAYSEAPGLIGALLSGGLVSCAFLAILRFYGIANAAGAGGHVRGMLLFMGLLSMGLAAVSMARQRDIKRMLAYSSVEHMGILIFGIGIGGGAVLAALWHVIHNGLTKGALFLSAGNIHRAYGSRSVSEVRGVLHRLPFTGTMFLAGFLAITGSPFFAPFVSEYQMLRVAFGAGHFWAGGLFLVFLFLIFAGMGALVVPLSFGKWSPPADKAGPESYHEGAGTALPILAFMGLVVLLGIYPPPLLRALLTDAATFLEAVP